MATIGHLAGGVAHDFNNMLAGIMGAAELLKLQKDCSQEARGKYIDLFLTTCTRAAALTVKLLAFSRKSKVAFKPTQCCLVKKFVLPARLH